MELKYDVNSDGIIINAQLEGLTGCEHVMSLKQALELLQVKNPAVIFMKDVKDGVYDHFPDAEYNRMLTAVEAISLLWRCEGDQPEGKSTRPSLNVLMLLANAVELISRMYLLIRQ